ncbi:hypothetical protein G6011_04398 [Alternaria panax]|uniref:Uncharacterized protein n=1 Tax=Alternaria panax TaxID=48097 RepID=A0AAD4NTZ5_9PLEO|nr:hypothetical protein G6011_04398 [Alternaria panax]
MGVDYMQAPPDLKAWMPETDWLGQVANFGNHFTPTINQMLDTQIPERKQHAVSEHENIALDERNVDLASSPHMPYLPNVVIPDQLSSAARDRILRLVSKTAQRQITIPSFPSTECIDKLIKIGIAKKAETDA